MKIFKRSLTSWLFWTILYLLCKISDGKIRGTSSLGAELVLVETIFRHGERNPQFLFPTDKENNISTWFQGSYGELTPKGMKQVFSLGQQFAQLYGRFLNLNFAAKEVYMRSTDRNRTLTSAVAFLNGLLKESLDSKYGFGAYSKLRHFQPIPVHSIYGPSDSVVLVDTPCPRATEIFQDEVMKEPDWVETVAENKDFIQWLEVKSGIKNLTLDHLWKIVDPLTVEKNYPVIHPWPEWVNTSVLDRVQNLVNFVTLRKYHRKSLARLRGGQLLAEIVGRMKHKIFCLNNKNDNSFCSWIRDLKFYVYSAHESTVLAVLETLARNNRNSATGAGFLSKGSFPLSGASLIFELWKDFFGKFFVKIMYKNHYKAGMVPVWVSNGCKPDGQCSFQTFYERSQPFIPNSWEKECFGFDKKQERNTMRFRLRKSELIDLSPSVDVYNLSIAPPVTYVSKKKNCNKSTICSKDQKLLSLYRTLTYFFGTLFVTSLLFNGYLIRGKPNTLKLKLEDS